jgi:hypothetical protein
MKIFFFKFLFIVFLFLYAMSAVQRVSAHGDDPRIELSAEQLNPGAVLDLRGVDFERDAEVILTLVGAPTQIPFGSVLTDGEGIFQLTITLPADLPEGTYVIRAASTDHVLDSPQFVVSGSADLGTGEQRELEEPLLAPMPTVPAIAATAVPQSAQPTEAVAEQNSAAPFLWIAAGVVVAVLSGFLIGLKRS